MNYRILGKSTLTISEIGFGSMSLGTNDLENLNLVNRAIELGINFFDTADIYQEGLNEHTLGRILKGKREQMVIATKVGNVLRKGGGGWDWKPRKDYILSAVDGSLQRLKTDYIDLYQLHGGTMDDPIDEIIEAFEILQKQGKIRFYGLSSIRPNVIREYIQRSSIVSVMMQYSLLDRRAEESCLKLLLENQVGVLARGSLAKGLLINKPATEYLNYDKDQVAQASGKVKSVSGVDRSPSQTAISFVKQQKAITSVIVGLRTIGQLEDVVGTHNIRSLESKDFQSLSESIPVNFYDQHR